MPLTAGQRDAVVSELKRIGADLNLSEEQKQKVLSSLRHGILSCTRASNTNRRDVDLPVA